jgi:hypothetical protein
MVPRRSQHFKKALYIKLVMAIDFHVGPPGILCFHQKSGDRMGTGETNGSVFMIKNQVWGMSWGQSGTGRIFRVSGIANTPREGTVSGRTNISRSVHRSTANDEKGGLDGHPGNG